MKKILLLLLILLMIPVSFADTYILQTNGTKNLADNQVQDDIPNTPAPSGAAQFVQSYSSPNIYRLYFSFENNATIKNCDSSTVSARFQAYLSSAPANPMTIEAHEVNSTWDTNTLTWNNQPCGTAFDDGSNCNLTASDSLSVSQSSNLWQWWNITSIVKKSIGEVEDNITFVIKDDNEGNGDNRWREWRMGDYTATNPALIPILNISCDQVSTANTAPVFNIVTPSNNSLLSSSFDVTVNVTDDSVGNMNCELRNETVIYDQNTTVDDNVPFTLTYSRSGEFSELLNITCSDEVSGDNMSSTYLLNFTLDTVSPTITVPSPANQSSIDKTFNNLSVGGVCSDDAVNEFNISFFNGSQGIAHSFSNTPSGNQISLNSTFDLTNVAPGSYQINYSCSDSHTANRIEDYDVQKNEARREFTFNTDKGEEITIRMISSQTPVSLTLSTTKKKDRYEFSFDGETTRQQYAFDITAPGIRYLADSPFKGHFVTKNHWIDFENGDPTASYQATYQGKNTWRLTITTSSLQFSSVGGLNIIEFTNNVTITETTDLTITNLNPANNSVNSPGSINISWSIDYDSSCDLLVNETINETGIDSNAGTVSQAVIFPQNSTFSWRVNCTSDSGGLQKLGPFFLFSTNSTPETTTQQVGQTFSMGDCPDTTSEVMILWIFFILGVIFLFWGGLEQKIGLFGFIGSLMLMFTSLYVRTCLNLLADFVISISFILIVYFLFSGFFFPSQRKN